MLRASSLGLHISSTNIPIFQPCRRAPGVIIGLRSWTFANRSLPLHISVHPRQTSHDARLAAESLRQGGIVCPAVFTSSVAEDQLLPSHIRERHIAKGIVGQRENDSAETVAVVQESMVDAQPTTSSVAVELLEGAGESTETSPASPYIQEAPFPSGRPWVRQSVKPLRANSQNGHRHQRPVVIPSFEDQLWDVERVYQDMLHVLATTTSAEDGWKAYGVLSKLQHQYDTAEGGDSEPTAIIPFAYLHRLARLICQNTPKTRTQFLRLLSVLTTVQNYGGEIQLHEWNALIDHAGKGWRKTRPEDFNNSLSIYYDMIYGRPPGSQFSDAAFDDVLRPRPESEPFSDYLVPTPAVEPDIHTYTTLIDIAARTNHPPTLHRATMLLKQAKLPPNRITHLALLKYFTTKKQLSGVRSTITKMKEQDLELGVDGLNACMWAYGHNNRVDVVMMIYRLLRHNIVPEEYDDFDNIASVQEQLRIEEGIVIAPGWRPNEVSFTLMIQTMAYHGNLLAALSVFIDMLSTPNVEQGAPLVPDQNDELRPIAYSPTIHVFRALLLGFSRHGVNSNNNCRPPVYRGTNMDGPEWNLENLQSIFERFLELPSDTKISESTIFWTLNSFSRTSDYNVELLRTVWQRMEDRFGTLKGGPNHRLTKWRHKLFPEAKKLEYSG